MWNILYSAGGEGSLDVSGGDDCAQRGAANVAHGDHANRGRSRYHSSQR